MTARLNRWLPRWTVAYARLRGGFSRRELPPGPLLPLDREEKTDRRFLLQHFSRHGPIFKAVAWNEFWVCITGLARCERFLRDNATRVRPVTLALGELFPKGFLRQMQGGEHQTYRRALVRGIRDEDPARLHGDLEATAARGLRDFYLEAPGNEGSAQALIRTLTRISSGMLVQIFFGAKPGSPRFDALLAGYQKLGPHGLVWNPGPRQESAFRELRDALRRQLGDPEGPPDGILRRIDQRGCPHGVTPAAGPDEATGAIDETLLGNLIYMVEMGRYDTRGLFRWLTKYAAENPALLSQIAAECATTSAAKSTLARAFVLESLRMDQSERLVRRAERDIVFDGYLIPRFTMIRLCLWESHKSEESFPEPFRFDPSRFLSAPPAGDQFSPFGLDHHRCPLADVSIDLGVAFVRALAREFTVTPLADGKPMRGPYHWEPSHAFCVQLERREPDPDAARP